MPFPVTTGYGSTSSIALIQGERGRLSCFAASDIFKGTPVTLQASSIGSSSVSLNSGFAVRMCASQNDQPLGIARDDAKAGDPVAVYDIGNVLRLTVSGSVNAAMQIGVTNTSSATHPISNVAGVVYPVLGQVTGASTSNYAGSTNSYNAAWAIGQNFEPGNPGQGVAIQINPRLLSGLA